MKLILVVGIAVMCLILSVIFKQWFVLILVIGIILFLILLGIRLMADFYWYMRDKGW